MARYLTRGTSYTILLAAADAATLALISARALRDRQPLAGLQSHPATVTTLTTRPVRTVLRLRPHGSRRGVHPVGLDRLPGNTGYVRGTGTLRVPVYERVLYRGVYQVDVLVDASVQDGQLEYDWRLASRADVRATAGDGGPACCARPAPSPTRPSAATSGVCPPFMSCWGMGASASGWAGTTTALVS